MTQETVTKKVLVTNPQGLHARPAHAFVTTANEFQADIQVIRNGEAVDGKSILSILTLAAVQGTELTLKAVGQDAEQALAALESLFANGFGEAEGAGSEAEPGGDGSPSSSESSSRQPSSPPDSGNL